MKKPIGLLGLGEIAKVPFTEGYEYHVATVPGTRGYLYQLYKKANGKTPGGYVNSNAIFVPGPEFHTDGPDVELLTD